VDSHSCALPVNWKKGDKVIVPPPKTLKELDARLADASVEKVDFYLAKKELA
jgi:peroxiredoxin (alkyl hydroperoxide reductase subunit C)